MFQVKDDAGGETKSSNNVVIVFDASKWDCHGRCDRF